MSAAQEKGARRDGWAGAKRKDGLEEGEVWAGLGCGKEKGEGKNKSWAGLGWAERVREIEKALLFFRKDSNTFNLNSNSKIRI